jgi:hypothetical protein
VGSHAFGGWQNVDVARLVKLDDLANRLRNLPFHWIPSLRSGFASAITEYASHLASLYVSMARVSQANVIVETSKEPNFASLLTRIPNNKVHLIHLVRDSRAVAHSWTRSQRMPSPIGDQQFMPRFNPRNVAARWSISNLAFHALGRTSPRIRVNYEDFIADPSEQLRKISEFTGEQFRLDSSRLSGSNVRLGDHHIFSGNPMRSSTGWLEMRLDDEWRTALPAARASEVTAMTWPLLRLYGYPLVPPPSTVRSA